MKYYTFLVTTQDLETAAIFVMDEEGFIHRHSYESRFRDNCRYFILNPEQGFEEWYPQCKGGEIEEIRTTMKFLFEKGISPLKRRTDYEQ